MSEPRPRSVRPEAVGTPTSPTPVRAVVADAAGSGPTPDHGAGLPEGTVCSLMIDGRRWRVRIAGRSLSGRGTHRPVELALLLFEPLDAQTPSGDAGADAPPGTLEVLVPTRQIETHRGFEPEAIEAALERAEPTSGAGLRGTGFFKDVDRSGRGRRGS